MGKDTKSNHEYIVYPRPRKIRHRGKTIIESAWQAAWEVPQTLLPPGKSRKRITGTGGSRTEAVENLMANIELFKSGQRKGRTKTVNNSEGFETGYTVESYLLDYIENYKRNYVHENTYLKYRKDFERYVIPYVGKKRLEDLSYQDCKKLVLEIWPNLKATKVIKGKTTQVPLLGKSALRSQNTQLTSALKHAQKKLGLKINPMASFPVESTTETEPIEAVIEVREKVALMFNAMDKSDPNYVRFVIMYLALRPGEKLALRWHNITDLFGNSPMLKIEQTLGFSKGRGGYYEDPPKSGQTRKIPIFEPALSALREHYTRTQEWKKLPTWRPEARWSDIVLLEGPSGFFVSPKSDTARWKKLMLAADITLPDENGEEKHIRQHLMRHISATVIADAEDLFDLEDAQKLLGHANTAMTYFYARRDPQVLARNLQGFNPLAMSLPKNDSNVVQLRKRGR
jgi:integrase